MIVEETFENPVAGTSHDEDEAKQRAKLTRSELIAKQRLQTLQQMQALQENFMKNHATYLAVVDAEMQEEENVSMQFTCLLCQATEVVGAPESRPMVMTGLVQQSTILCRKREKVKRSLEDDKSMACISKDFPCLPNNLGPAPYVSSCGHKLHTECFYTYHAKSVEAESQRLLRDLPPLFDVDKGELLCPLCKNLSNVVLPVLQPMDTFMLNSEKELVDFNLDDWLSSLKIFLGSRMEEQLDLESKRKHSSLLEAQKQPILKTELTDSFSQLTETIYKAATSQGLQSYVEHHPTYVWQTCAYTIHALEWVQRESGKALLGQFTSRQEETLRALILSSALDPAFLNSNALRNITFDLLKIVMQPEDTDTCIIEWDMFGLLVSLTLAIPSLFASGEHMFYLPACATKELHTLHLVLLANIVNLMLGMAVEQTDVPMEVDTTNSEISEEDMDGQEALNLLKIVCEAAKIPAPTYEFTPSQLWQRLTQDCVPFLRCCAIFFRFLSGVPASPALSEPGGDTFTNLCAFLGLPTTCKDLLGYQTTSEMAKSEQEKRTTI
ncbi:hypothetical protein B566_EDAN004248 [Ephemera danica]|nr:hypothetical protein B566_EDAN004248 [Ephemera danica]